MGAGIAGLLRGYMGLVDDIHYKQGDELRQRYAAGLQTDAAIIDMTRERLFWTDSEADKAALMSALTHRADRWAYHVVLQRNNGHPDRYR